MDRASRTNGPLRVGIILFGLLAALAAGSLALFTVGETYALATAVTILVTSLAIAFTASVLLGRAILVLLIFTLAGSLTIGALGAIQILAAFAGSPIGPVDEPDAQALEAAEHKIDQSIEATTFSVTLSEAELNAVLQDSLTQTDTPFRRITVDILNTVGQPALIGFVGDFKDGSLRVDGELTAATSGGELHLELLSADVGMFTLPGVARGAVEDMIGRVADLNRALADEGADVQSVVIGDDAIVVTGVTTGSGTIDAGVLLASFGDLDGLGTTDLAVEPFAAGIDSATADGERYYVALGDSLAAAVGVDGYAEGYVSQVHKELSLRDGAVYGLRNFGVSGETSGTMLLGSQLDTAVEFGSGQDVAYVTIDVGANDLLGHLASSDCSEDIEAAPCTARIEASLTAYRNNIAAIFEASDKAFPDATVIFLLAYNPFSLGFEDEVSFEAQSNEALISLNTIAAEEAAEYGILVADGFTPMRGTTTATTHMTDLPPDIHPNAVGYDVLTAAVLAALS
ncbi:MAG: GDSL-type esterase/lipase family protein [Actinomycetota bacterium]|nr:GDSL-type esterase/lipase family protein [Actinomycetota bacterium]